VYKCSQLLPESLSRIRSSLKAFSNLINTMAISRAWNIHPYLGKLLDGIETFFSEPLKETQYPKRAALEQGNMIFSIVGLPGAKIVASRGEMTTTPELDL
jgi:hypothetical protein